MPSRSSSGTGCAPTRISFQPASSRGGRPLNVVAQDFIGKAPASLLAELDIPDFGRVSADQDRERVGQSVSAFIKNKPMREQHALGAALLPQFERMDGFRPTPVMNRSEITQIAEVHELGAHSFEHATMAAEDDDYVAADARRCRAYFADVLKRPTSIYAFPNGSYRPQHPAMIREAGFDTILLVNEDFSSAATRDHSRFNIYGTSTASFGSGRPADYANRDNERHLAFTVAALGQPSAVL